MEINKQLFEDVLSGKLEGNFVLKNGFRINSNRLCKEVENIICPYWLKGFPSLYTREGIPNSTFREDYTIVDFIPKPKYKAIDLEMLEYCRKDFDFMKTLSKAINNMNTLEIEIPSDKEIDWDESKKQNKIVLKDKQLTYEDICDRLPEMIDVPLYDIPSKDGNALVANEHQLECILAKNKLANVAKYLNGEWKPRHDKSITSIVVLMETKTDVSPCEVINGSCSSYCGSIWFKSKDLARQAIEILGEETVKLALEPLGI